MPMKEKKPKRSPGRPRTKDRAAVRERQAAHGFKVDDLDHGETEIPLHLFARGRLIKRYLQCGKKECACHKGGKKHGPYHYLVVTVPAKMRGPGDPKQKWYYLTKEEAETFKTRIRNFNQLANNMFSDLQEELDTGKGTRRRR